jgi:hypothetical protein
MRKGRFSRIVALVALVVAGSVLAFSLHASNASASSAQNANQAVRGLVNSDLVRAEIVTLVGGKLNDYRVYRGAVQKIRGRLLTLAGSDGAVVQIRLSAITQIRLGIRRVVARRVRAGMYATAIRKGNAPASWLYLARRLPDRSESKIKSLLSIGLVRAEVVSQVAGALFDTFADTGVIRSVDNTSLTLNESDGATAQMQLDSATQVRVNNRVADTTALTTGMKATTIRSGDGPVSQIWAFGKKPAKNKGGRRK